MNHCRNTWVAFRPDSLLMAAVSLSLLSILVSWLMIAAETPLVNHLLRQVLQVMLLSIVLPFILLHRRNGFRAAGIRFDRWWLYILISFALATLLTLQMGLDIGFDSFHMPRGSRIEGAVYVMVTNIAEVLFFACFLRYAFEQSLGIVPGIILAAGAFSLHHAGFQPEFLKLFMVGLVFISVIRIARHWLVAFPMWWVGGLLDVLFGSEATSAVDWSGFSAWATVILLVISIMFYTYRDDFRRQSRRPKLPHPESNSPWPTTTVAGNGPPGFHIPLGHRKAQNQIARPPGAMEGVSVSGFASAVTTMVVPPLPSGMKSSQTS